MSYGDLSTNTRPKPVLILMAGLPGVGKSMIARELARLLNAPLLDKDDVLDYLKRSSITDSLEQGRIAYDVLFRQVDRQLALGLSVVVDTCLTFGWLRKRLLALATEHQAIPLVVLCECPSAVAQERIQQRAADEALFDGRTWEEHLRIREAFAPIDDLVDVVLDTRLAPAENAAAVVTRLNEKLGQVGALV